MDVFETATRIFGNEEKAVMLDVEEVVCLTTAINFAITESLGMPDRDREILESADEKLREILTLKVTGEGAVNLLTEMLAAINARERNDNGQSH